MTVAEDRKWNPPTDDDGWIVPVDQAEADRFITGLGDAINDLNETIAELQGAISTLRAERLQMTARLLDLMEGEW